jgi:hypothetical protein
MKVFNLFLILFLFFGLTFGLFGQTNKKLEKYLKIKALINNREDVEKLYGKGDVGKVNKYFVWYEILDMAILVDYVSKPCNPIYPLWNVPEWTVEEIRYTPQKKLPKLKDLMPDMTGYIARPGGDVPDHIDYYNAEKGISIGYDKYTKRVSSIGITATLSDEEKFKCKLENN